LSDTANFEQSVSSVCHEPLGALGLEILQVNMGSRCNMACKHCHVQAGPERTEMMGGETVDAVIGALRGSDVAALDITGGAPELNPHFRRLVREGAGLGRRVMARSNLTIFFEPGMEDLPGFYAEHNVEVIASLPYYSEAGVDRVRGSGAFSKSIAALQELNGLGYGRDCTGRVLDLVYNPQGAFLPPGQSGLEEQYRRQLLESFGISFNRLFTFTNVPIGRFRDFLLRSGNYEKYLQKLSGAFNPCTLDGLMCRRLVSVAWDGALYDCDFNQALGLRLREGAPGHITEFDCHALSGRSIALGDHCFACTAGQGST
jgi:radical SAM/Cys-rich protein